MAKHRRRARKRMQQSGMGRGVQVVHRMPKLARRLPNAPVLDAETELRLRCVEYSYREGVAAAVTAFKRSRATIDRWRQRDDPSDLRSRRPRSRRPKHTRKQQWTPTQEQAVWDLRQRYPRSGKAKLVFLLRARGILLSESMIGRILASLKRRRLLIEPHVVRVRQRRAARPYATRVPKDQRQPTVPGQLIQLDTMHLRPEPGVERRQFTAIDVVSRCAVLGVRASATAGTATALLDERWARMPVPIQAIQVDGGSEFMAGFETACQAKGIARDVLPPRSPKLNGRVERLTGTVRREFWECDDGELDLPTLGQALRAWETQSKTERPHQALAYRSPRPHLDHLRVSHVSNSHTVLTNEAARRIMYVHLWGSGLASHSAKSLVAHTERLQRRRSTAARKGGGSMREARIATISLHAGRRLAQRNLSRDDIGYVFAHGRLYHAGKALFVHLGRRDIPSEHRRHDRLRRLEGTVLVLDPSTGQHLTTAYRNRRRGSRDIKRKSKRAQPDDPLDAEVINVVD